jgi:hypothetical protein
MGMIPDDMPELTDAQLWTQQRVLSPGQKQITAGWMPMLAWLKSRWAGYQSHMNANLCGTLC